MRKSTLLALTLGSAFIVNSPVRAQDDAAKGKEVFEQCSVCHAADSEEKKMGPGLKGLTKKAKMKNGKAPTDANLSSLIKTGGGGMPAYEDMLSADELKQLLAYLKTL
jgi:mono/diheme cytochrome c family protein